MTSNTMERKGVKNVSIASFGIELTLVSRFAGGGSVCDADHQQGLLQGVGSRRAEQHGLQDLLIQAGSEGRQTFGNTMMLA